MRDWLTIELVLAMLLVTSFTCVGLVALWAATSPRHWFVRTGVVLLVFSPLLLIPAYGAFLAFVLSVGLVVIGITVYRRWRKWREPIQSGSNGDQRRQPARWQFSLKSALALCTSVAMLAAIVVKIPAETWIAWEVFTVAAIIAAAITLTAAWVVGGKAERRQRIACAFAFPFALIAGAIITMRYSDMEVPIVDDALEAYVSMAENGAALFSVIGGGVFVALVLILLLVSVAFADDHKSPPYKAQSAWARVALLPIAILLLAPSLFVLASLLKPLRDPDNRLPVPNGYDELVRIGKQFQKSAIQTELAADVVDEKKLAVIIPTYDALFAELRRALKLPFRVPIRYDVFVDIDTEAFGALRTLARVLDAKADTALRAGRIDESLACCAEILQLAESAHQGGLLAHYLVASAIEDIALSDIYQSINYLDAAQFRAVLRNLAEYEQRRESFDEVVHREKVWIDRTYGWPGRLGMLLQEIAGKGDSPWVVNKCRLQNHPENQAVARLLMVEMALRAYQLDHGQLPDELTTLVPDYFAILPHDPFSSNGQSFHFSLTNDGFDLSSVGPRTVDSHSQSLVGAFFAEATPGGLRIKSHFAPREHGEAD